MYTGIDEFSTFSPVSAVLQHEAVHPRSQPDSGDYRHVISQRGPFLRVIKKKGKDDRPTRQPSEPQNKISYGLKSIRLRLL